MRLIGFVSFALSSFWLSAAAADPAAGVDWEVKHRFRVVYRSQHDEFIRHFNSFVEGRGPAHVLDPSRSARGSNLSPLRPQLATHYDAVSGQYNHAWFHRSERQITVRSLLQSDRLSRCQWRLDGQEWSPLAPCRTRVTLEAKLGEDRLWLRVERPDSIVLAERGPIPITIKDLKFVALGDSFASGEGNPHVTFNQGTDGQLSNPRRLADWWDHRCHRSLFASSAQAAVMLAQKRRDTSVTYVSYACSGGTINRGMVGPYQGVESREEVSDRIRFFAAGSGIGFYPRQEIPPQLEMARTLLCKNFNESPCREAVQPDIVSFTTGGNELEFGPKVTACATSTCRFTEATMRPFFEGLKEQYQRLAPELNALKARSVFLVTYPNMTRAADGRTYCGDQPFDFDRSFVPSLSTYLSFGISRSEARSAERFVLNPLNASISASATAEGWVPVGGFSRKHGFCVRKPGSWFYTVMESMNRQGVVGRLSFDEMSFAGNLPSGAMHPNVFGHAEMRGRLLAEIEKRFSR